MKIIKVKHINGPAAGKNLGVRKQKCEPRKAVKF